MKGLARYEQIRCLGDGGMGTVHLARDRVLRRLVALKRLRPELDRPDLHHLEFKRRFAREAMILAQLQHSHVISVYDYFEEDGDPILVMEYIDGDTLRTIITEKRPIALVQKLAIIEDLAAGLACVHEAGIIHRDIKPGNVMVTRAGVVKLLDFGVAKPPGTALTSHGAVVGTPNYMSPEQVRGEVLDCRSDLFSLSALLYEFVSLTPPFSGAFVQVTHAILEKHPPSLRSLADGLPDGLDALVRRGMAKDPSQRPNSAGEFRAALQAVRLGAQEAPTVHNAKPAAPTPDGPDRPDSIEVDPASAPGEIFAGANERPRDRPRLYAFATAGAVLVLILVVLIAWPGPSAPIQTEPSVPPKPSAQIPLEEVGGGAAGRRQGTAATTTQAKKSPEHERGVILPSATNASAAAPGTGASRLETPVNPLEPKGEDTAAPAPASASNESTGERPVRIDVNTSEDGPAVEQLLADFTRAHNERDVPALKQLYPSLPQAEAVALTRAFVDYDAYRVSLSDVRFSVTGDHGRVRGRMSRAITPSKGDARVVNAVLDAAVQRVDGVWVFTRVTLQ
jgi:serine/threonine-protein kinase